MVAPRPAQRTKFRREAGDLVVQIKDGDKSRAAADTQQQ
jgi:hypothetical protein